MKISERELEDFIFDNLNKKKFDYLRSIGFLFNGIQRYTFNRQLSIGNYGRADIVGFNVSSHKDRYGRNKVESFILELKEGPITESSVVQILRYKGGIDSALSMYDHISCELAIIGSSIDESLRKQLSLLSPYISAITYELSLSGISFINKSIIHNDDLSLSELDIPDEGDKIKNIITELTQLSENEIDIVNTEQ